MHPYHFAELAAYGAYTSFKLNRTPKYLISSDGQRNHIFVLPIGGMSAKPVFDEFDHEEYGRVLAGFLNVDLSDVYDGEGVWTCLRGDDGNPRFISLAEQPVS